MYTHAANWLRELINAFCTQRGPSQNVLRNTLVKRIKTLIAVEDALESYLDVAKGSKAKKSSLERKNIEDLEKKQILRPLDPLTANIFDFREGVDNPEVEDDVATPPEGRAEGEFLTVLEPDAFYYLIRDFTAKTQFLLKPPPKLGSRVTPSWFQYESPLACIREIKYAYSALGQHLKQLATKVTNVPQDDDDESVPPQVYAAGSTKLILDCLRVFFLCETFAEDENLLKEILGAMVDVSPSKCLKASVNDLLHKAFELFENFGSILEDFDIKVHFIELLVSLQRRQKQERFKESEKSAISNIAGRMLTQKWEKTKIKKEEYVTLLQLYITKSENPFAILSRLASSHFNEVKPAPWSSSKKSKSTEDDTDTSIDDMPMLNSHSFPIFF